jgi:hypothetical protein
MPPDSRRLDKIRDETIAWLRDIADDEGLGSQVEIDPESKAVVGQIESKGRKIVFELHSSGNRIELETIYKMFLRILLTESQKGAIICSSEVSEDVGNLARLYGISMIPMRTRSVMETSLKKTFADVFS